MQYRNAYESTITQLNSCIKIWLLQGFETAIAFTAKCCRERSAADLWFAAQLNRAHNVHQDTTCCLHTSSGRKLSVPPTRSTVSARLSSTPFVRRSERHVTRPAANQQSALCFTSDKRTLFLSHRPKKSKNEANASDNIYDKLKF